MKQFDKDKTYNFISFINHIVRIIAATEFHKNYMEAYSSTYRKALGTKLFQEIETRRILSTKNIALIRIMTEEERAKIIVHLIENKCTTEVKEYFRDLYAKAILLEG